MIKIAVVDDEKKERDAMLAFFQKLQAKIKEELWVLSFSSGDEFLEVFDDSFDLVCLDIDMEGRDGISTAKEVRNRESDVTIIFITNMAQMAIRGYEVQALDFVLKPVNYYSFALKMRNAINIISSKKEKNIILHTSGGVQKISTDQLLYIEVSAHYLCYHTTRGEFRQKSSLKEVEKKLEGLSFKRCNSCYLVNLKYVDGVGRDEVMIGRDCLKISRPKKKEFLQSLANYMGGIGI